MTSADGKGVPRIVQQAPRRVEPTLKGSSADYAGRYSTALKQDSRTDGGLADMQKAATSSLRAMIGDISDSGARQEHILE
jgi:hypothetical protein